MDVDLLTIHPRLAILSLLCNHPDCFNAKLHERKQDARKEIAAVVDAPSSRDGTDLDEIAAELNASIWKVGVSQDLINEETRLFTEEATDMKSIDLSYKVKILCQILDASKAAGDKVLVFSQSIPTLNFLEDLCDRQGRKIARLDGKTTMSKRQDMTKSFNKGKTEIYLISTAAGGLGLNLPSANRVVIFDFKFNPIMEEQAIGRAYRIGQLKPTFVYRFVSGGTFEDSVHNKTVFKMQLASRVVDKKNPVAWATKKLGDFLFEPKDVPQKDLSEFMGMDPLVLDKILESQRDNQTIRTIVQSDTFERDDEDKLTAEEEKEVKQLLSDEQLKRSNPQKWHQLQVQRSQQAYNQAQRQAQQANHPQMSNGSANRPGSANQGMNRPFARLPARLVNGQDKVSIPPPPPPPPRLHTGMSAGNRLSSSNSSMTNGALPVKTPPLVPETAPVPSQVPLQRPHSGPQKSPLVGNSSHRSYSPIAGANTKIRTPTPENEKKSSGQKTPAPAPIPRSPQSNGPRREGSGSPEKQNKVRIPALVLPISEQFSYNCIHRSPTTLRPSSLKQRSDHTTRLTSRLRLSSLIKLHKFQWLSEYR